MAVPTPEEIAVEQKRLEAMQATTQQPAAQIAGEALAAMMSMGWRFDAHFTEQTTPEGKKMAVPTLVIRALTLEEWHAVGKERIKKQFLA